MDGLARVRELRATDPEAIPRAAALRRRRPVLGPDGGLLVVAADHPARNSPGVRRESMAMADREDLLDRLVIALSRPGVDGVLGTPDVIEDLLLLGALEGKVVIGSMNRGGLQGAAFELDDRFIGYDAPSIAASGFDGGKMLCRIDLADAGSVATMTATAAAIGSLAAVGLLAMVEPFLVSRRDGRVHNQLDPESVMRSILVAQALGTTSARTWLKLPVVAEMERVMSATTLPTVLLGGDPSGHPDDTYQEWRRALKAPNVRGLVVGRSLLYPPDGDVPAAVDIAAGMVHTRMPG